MSDELMLGNEFDSDTGKTERQVSFDLSSHAALIGVTRCGKGVTIEVPNFLLSLTSTTILNIDPTGQNFAICAEAQRKAGKKTIAINPSNLHIEMYPDMRSRGCNPMRSIKIENPRRLEQAYNVADAWDWSREGNRFFDDAGRILITGVILYTKWRDGKDANLNTVLQLLMEAEKLDANKQPTQGLRYTAAKMIATGDFQMAAIAGKYLKDNRTIDSVRATAETAGASLISNTVREDLCKDGIDWAEIAQSPHFVSIILPAEDLGFHSAWLRLIVSSALNSLYELAGDFQVKTLFLLSEFFALGQLKSVQNAMGQAAKYGCVMLPVVQDWNQLTSMYGRDGASTFIANTGCLIAFAPNDSETAEFLSRHSGDTYVVNESTSQNEAGEVNKSYSTQRERLWSPERIRRVPPFCALVWKYGNPAPQLTYLQPYFENKEAMRLARPDPYRRNLPKGGAASPRTTETPKAKGGAMRWLMKKIAAAVVIWLVLVVISVSWVTISNMVQSR